MTYQSLYRSYRPVDFEEVVGQNHIKQTLKNAIKKNQLAHAYLFCGPRGTGKTSIAKIFAKAINCEKPEKAPCGECQTCQQVDINHHPDIIEIDAASNNGVDEIRDLIEKVKYAPIELTYKVYIIDEVHMLTQGAFNALLKTLEEPPEHVIFILATTDVHKVIPTIISRTQRYDFERVSQADIISRLEIVFENEKIQYEDNVLELIASLADGGVRDALTISEQVISYAGEIITLQDVQKVYKVVGAQDKYVFLKAILDADLDEVLSLMKNFETQSIEYKRLINDLITMAKEASIYSLTNNKEYILPIQQAQTIELSETTARNHLLQLIEELLMVVQNATFNGLYQDYLEIAAIKLAHDFAKEPNKLKEPFAVEEKPWNHQSETKVEEQMSVDQPIETVDTEFILECMVLGDKQLKQTELEQWSKLKDYQYDIRYRKVSPYLLKATIAISGDDYLVLVSERNEEVALINNNQELVSELLELIIGTKKEVTAITLDTFNEVVEIFRVRNENDTLPNREEILQRKQANPKDEPVSEPTHEEVMLNFFGDSLTIIE